MQQHTGASVFILQIKGLLLRSTSQRLRRETRLRAYWQAESRALSSFPKTDLWSNWERHL